jgi:RNA-directed DNA polymerase
MSARERLARSLAMALLAGEWTAEDLNRRASRYFGRPLRAARRRLIREMIESATTPYPPSPEWLVAHLLASERFLYLSADRQGVVRPAAVVLEPAAFAPLTGLSELGVPQLRTAGELADWLELTPAQLDWFADAKRLQGRTAIPVLQHYSYTFIPKRTGLPRLIEAPKPKLLAIQRLILREILDPLPAHENAHGFVRGRSCLTGAQIHAGEHVVLAIDLASFFASVPLPRVHAIFRCLGYTSVVARLLTGLCSTTTPPSAFLRCADGRLYDWETRKRYGVPHLAQGAPTSPALANLAAWHMDQRLAGLARRFGANYTRYADDLTFSGGAEFSTRIEAFRELVGTIVTEEGFSLNGCKTRIMHRSTRQRVTGLVVNDHLNVPRSDYDALKAILHNCVKLGPQEQNRSAVSDFRAHLDGRVAWVEAANPHRGAKLRQTFNAIRW